MKFPKINQREAAIAAANIIFVAVIVYLIYKLIMSMRSKPDTSTRIPTIHTNKDRPSLRSRGRHAPWHEAGSFAGRGKVAAPRARTPRATRPTARGTKGQKGPTSARRGMDQEEMGHLSAKRGGQGKDGVQGTRGKVISARGAPERPYNNFASYYSGATDFLKSFNR